MERQELRGSAAPDVATAALESAIDDAVRRFKLDEIIDRSVLEDAWRRDERRRDRNRKPSSKVVRKPRAWEIELVTRHKAGDGKATRALFEYLKPALTWVLRNYWAHSDGNIGDYPDLRSPPDASIDWEDYLQVGRFAIWRCLGSWDPARADLRTYAEPAIRNAMADLLRKAVRQAEAIKGVRKAYRDFGEDGLFNAGPDLDEAIDLAYKAGDIDDHEREIIEARRQGETWLAIVARLGVPERTLRNRLTNALSELGRGQETAEPRAVDKVQAAVARLVAGLDKRQAALVRHVMGRGPRPKGATGEEISAAREILRQRMKDAPCVAPEPKAEPRTPIHRRRNSA